MEPVYVDVHIHTSENPDSLNQNYDIDTLFEKVRAQAQGQHGLISLTDHNTINKKAYLDAIAKCGLPTEPVVWNPPLEAFTVYELLPVKFIK